MARKDSYRSSSTRWVFDSRSAKTGTRKVVSMAVRKESNRSLSKRHLSKSPAAICVLVAPQRREPSQFTGNDTGRRAQTWTERFDPTMSAGDADLSRGAVIHIFRAMRRSSPCMCALGCRCHRTWSWSGSVRLQRGRVQELKADEQTHPIINFGPTSWARPHSIPSGKCCSV